MLRTTCVATRLEAGHADNALPQRATATVNCRILPGVDPSNVMQELARVIGDPGVTIQPVERAHPSPPTPLNPGNRRTDRRRRPRDVERAGRADHGKRCERRPVPADRRHPDLRGLPDSSRIPNDIRDHGRDERIDPQRYYDAVAFWDRDRQSPGGEVTRQWPADWNFIPTPFIQSGARSTDSRARRVARAQHSPRPRHQAARRPRQRT